jgi:hypothetical protein
MHSPAALTSWLGDSVGWWEKDTLVMETKYFSPSSAVRPRSRKNVSTRPWTGETHLLRSTKRMFEFACHEGNYSMRDMLEAARANDLSTAAPATAK